MAIRLIALDLDGTLLDDDHATISERNKTALKNAAKKGIKIVIASGRTWSVLKSIVQKLDAADYALIANGAAVIDTASEKALFRQEIPYDIWKEVYRILKKHRAIFEVYHNSKTYVEKDMLTRSEFLQLPKVFVEELTKFMIPVVKPISKELLEESIEKFHVMTVPKDEQKSTWEELTSMGILAMSSSMPGNIEINLKGSNKATGLLALCQELRISKEEVMAFGDANNDLEMLEAVKWSFAMANGTDEVKKAAHYQAKRNSEDGVAIAIEQYVL